MRPEPLVFLEHPFNLSLNTTINCEINSFTASKNGKHHITCSACFYNHGPDDVRLIDKNTDSFSMTPSATMREGFEDEEGDTIELWYDEALQLYEALGAFLNLSRMNMREQDKFYKQKDS